MTNEEDEQLPPSDRESLLVQSDDLNTTTNRRRCASSDAIILVIWAAVAAAVYVVLWVAQSLLGDDGDEDYWLADLTLNILGYSTVFLPGYAVIRSVLGISLVTR